MSATIPTDVALDAMVQFEQRALMSRKSKTCADCGEPGTVTQGPTAYCHVAYYFCDECAAYWATKDPDSERMVDRRVRAGYAAMQSRVLLAELRAVHSARTLPAALAHHGFISKAAAQRREP